MKKITAHVLLRWVFFLALFGLVVLEAVYLRGVGLWLGLSEGVEFHPDAAKQVMALERYLSGQYIWYLHSLFIDGYPLFLSHLDEWLMRLIFWPLQGLTDWVSRGAINVTPQGWTLFYWVRSLRLVYGMLALLLIFFAAKILLRSRWWALLSVAVLALSPISYTVTHFGTGDVGVDLFCSSMLLFFALYLRRPLIGYLFLAGLMAGCAFAAKYQGVILFYLVGVFFGLLFLRRSVSLLGVFGRVGTSLAGLIVGVFLATPSLLLAPERTWKDMRHLMAFISTYSVDEQFLALPFYIRWWTSLSLNLPVIGRWFGVVSLVLGALALLVVTIRLYRRWRQLAAGEFAEMSFCLAVFSFPFFGLLLFCAAKPENQPSHFSFLLFPLALAVAYAGRFLWQKRLLGKLTSALLLLALFGEYEWRTLREIFFWQHSELGCLVREYCSEVVGGCEAVPGRAPSITLKYFYLEADNPVVFRNRCQAIPAPKETVSFWRQLIVTPGPTAPLNSSSSWIFLNGPVFPRNDHSFATKARKTVEKQLVCYDSWPLAIGIRSGYSPVAVKIRIGGQPYEVCLGQQQQVVIPLDMPKKWRAEPFPGPMYKQINIVPLAVSSQPGDCWITAMASDKEIENFRLFGGENLVALTNLTAGFDVAAVVSNMASLALYQNKEKGGQALTSYDSDLFVGPWLLPAGRYRFEGTVACLAATNSLVLVNHCGGKWNELACWELGPSVTNLVYEFSKSYAPYENNYQLLCSTGTALLVAWRLTPDTAGVFADLGVHDTTGQVPAWFGKDTVSSSAIGELALTNLFFADGALVLTGYAMQEGPPALGLRFKLLDCGIANFAELYVFVHFINSDGRLVQSMDYPLFLFTVGEGHLNFLLPPEPLPAGKYTVTMGVYNVRTESRLELAKKVDSRTKWLKRNELQLPGLLEVR